MRATPDIWIQKRLLPEPARFDKQVFDALSRQAGMLTDASFDVVIGEESDWSHCPGPNDWLSQPYDESEKVGFRVSGILVLRHSLRSVVQQGCNSAIPTADRITVLTNAVSEWLRAGILVAGECGGVPARFDGVATFERWAAQGEIPRRYVPLPFCRYPGESGDR